MEGTRLRDASLPVMRASGGPAYRQSEGFWPQCASSKTSGKSRVRVFGDVSRYYSEPRLSFLSAFFMESQKRKGPSSRLRRLAVKMFNPKLACLLVQFIARSGYCTLLSVAGEKRLKAKNMYSRYNPVDCYSYTIFIN